jgi:hypothetical protein
MSNNMINDAEIIVGSKWAIIALKILHFVNFIAMKP